MLELWDWSSKLSYLIQVFSLAEKFFHIGAAASFQDSLDVC